MEIGDEITATFSSEEPIYTKTHLKHSTHHGDDDDDDEMDGRSIRRMRRQRNSITS